MNKLLIYFVVILVFFVSFSTIISSEKQNKNELLNNRMNDIESYNLEIDIEFGSYEIKKTI